MAKPLSEYNRKRDFKITAEPSGAASGAQRNASALTFVIQKHDARNLHYDLRLELDGVLKSWAVPQGPQPRPSQKRLAVQVEDHPLSYGSFEGSIPAGQYGAGDVIVWDRGIRHPPRRSTNRLRRRQTRNSPWPAKNSQAIGPWYAPTSKAAATRNGGC